MLFKQGFLEESLQRLRKIFLIKKNNIKNAI